MFERFKKDTSKLITKNRFEAIKQSYLNCIDEMNKREVNKFEFMKSAERNYHADYNSEINMVRANIHYLQEQRKKIEEYE